MYMYYHQSSRLCEKLYSPELFCLFILAILHFQGCICMLLPVSLTMLSADHIHSWDAHSQGVRLHLLIWEHHVLNPKKDKKNHELTMIVVTRRTTSRHLASLFCGSLNVAISCRITFTPTVQHCSMATVIGLCLRLKLMQNYPPHFKVLICSVFLEFLL